MAEFYCYEGLRNGGTFKVADATVTKLAGNVKDIVGKVVTLTGNYEVGYGASGNRPLGFVEQVEKENVNGEDLVVSVVWNQSREDIPITGSPTAGSYAACNGSGGLTVAGTSIEQSAVYWGVDTDNKTCTVYIHG